MNEGKLHPSVRDFKDFINNYPKLVEEVRRSGIPWQEYYEKWSLLGEEDPMWEQYKEKSPEQDMKEAPTGKKKSELFGHLIKLTENMDVEKIQQQVQQLSNTILTVQEVLGQFQESKKTLPTSNSPKPFHWLRD